MTPFIRVRVSILVRQGERLCLVRHAKNGRRYWLLPGGGQEPFETAEQAAKRELIEETGIRIGGVSLLFARESMSAEEGRHILFLVFAGLAPDFSQMTPSIDPRVEGVDFVLPTELDLLPMYPTICPDIRQVLAGKTVPLFGSLPWAP